MTNQQDPPIGYKSPPQHAQFKKGHCRPKGRRKAVEGFDVHAFLTTPVKVTEGDQTRKIHPFELTLLKIAQRAIKGDMRAAERIIKEFDNASLLKGVSAETGWPSRLYMPIDHDRADWHENLEKYGPPPWPLEHDGLCHLEEWRDAYHSSTR